MGTPQEIGEAAVDFKIAMTLATPEEAEQIRREAMVKYPGYQPPALLEIVEDQLFGLAEDWSTWSPEFAPVKRDSRFIRIANLPDSPVCSFCGEQARLGTYDRLGQFIPTLHDAVTRRSAWDGERFVRRMAHGFCWSDASPRERMQR